MSSINLIYSICKLFQWRKTYGCSLKRKSFAKLRTTLLKSKLIFDIIQYEESEKDLFPSNVIRESSFERDIFQVFCKSQQSIWWGKKVTGKKV